MQIISSYDIGQIVYVWDEKENNNKYLYIEDIESWDKYRRFTYWVSELNGLNKTNECKFVECEQFGRHKVMRVLHSKNDYKKFLQEQKNIKRIMNNEIGRM